MKKVRNFLLVLYCLYLLTSVVLYVFGEFVEADMAVFMNASSGLKFALPTIMILLTLGVIPLSLWMFKKRGIHNDLIQHKETALAKWGTIRLVALGNLLVLNTFLYYAFGFEPTYGYLAIVTLLTMPFILPTMNRCIAETTEEPKPEPMSEDDQTAEPSDEKEA